MVQKAISFLPGAEDINLLFQKYVTKGVYLDDTHLTYKIEAARDHLHFFRAKLTEADRLEVLELGTGWYPIVPLIFYLCKVGRVTSLDIRSWASKENHLLAINRLLEWYDAGRLQPYIENIDEGRIEKLRQLATASEMVDVAEINTLIGLRPVITDARNTSFDSNTFDLICSNNTFEHIYPDILSAILLEFKRVIKSDGMMSHFIDLSDHFAHFDKSISIYNFLKFSPSQWKMIDNSIQPQNRLRWPDYLKMYSTLNIPVSNTQIRGGGIDEVKAVTLDPTYHTYSLQDLAISHGYIVSDMSGE